MDCSYDLFQNTYYALLPIAFCYSHTPKGTCTWVTAAPLVTCPQLSYTHTKSSPIAYEILAYRGISFQKKKKNWAFKRAIRIILKRILMNLYVKEDFKSMRILTIWSLYILQCILNLRNQSWFALMISKFKEILGTTTKNKL